MTYRVNSTLIIGICAGFMVSMTVMFMVITFFGFKAEEEQDVEKLCHFYNLIKKERKQQDNYIRMSYKLAAINWGRDVKEIDDRFLFRVNQIRGQANLLMLAHSQVKEIEASAELFMRLHTRMHEVLFENASMIKRIYLQISSVDDWRKATSDKDKLYILREVFQMHAAMRLFASKNVTNRSMISRLAADNLEELTQKCAALIDDDSFRTAVVKASGTDQKTVEMAFMDSCRNPGEMHERLVSLNTVFIGLVEKLPKRTYDRVMQTEIAPEGDSGETFAF